MTLDERVEAGFFIVDRIVKHQYRQGYRFLTAWEGYPINEATWEPVASFVQPDGRLNPVFERYCDEKRLPSALRAAARLMARSKRSQERSEQPSDAADAPMDTEM